MARQIPASAIAGPMPTCLHLEVSQFGKYLEPIILKLSIFVDDALVIINRPPSSDPVPMLV
jgi:hypothetical protein